MKSKRIVITGGPGTGKTALIKALENDGFYCFHEVIRDMTVAVKNNSDDSSKMINPIASAQDSKKFNDELLEARHKHFTAAEMLPQKQVFYDRGMPDVLAYMNYFEQNYETSYTNLCARNKYDIVLVLPPWKDIYVQDNERMENFEQATAIHDYLESTYRSFGYNPIRVPFGTIAERLKFVKNIITTSY